MRAFIAVEISDELRQKIAKLQAELPREGLTFVDPAQAHITLKFLGEISDEQVEKIKKELSKIKFKPFEVHCKGVGVFPSQKFVRVIWIGGKSNELDGIAKEINERLSLIGFRKEPFTFHLTIARVKRKIDLRNFLTAHADEDFGSFTVDKLKLKKSTLTPKGPVYGDIAEFGDPIFKPSGLPEQRKIDRQ